MDRITLSDGDFQWKWKQSFFPLHNIMLMNFRELLVFDTTGKVAKCTKFMISRVHNSTLWMEKGYFIHVEDIHQLTGLSMMGQECMRQLPGIREAW